jgi:hypothetical protein
MAGFLAIGPVTGHPVPSRKPNWNTTPDGPFGLIYIKVFPVQIGSLSPSLTSNWDRELPMHGTSQPSDAGQSSALWMSTIAFTSSAC